MNIAVLFDGGGLARLGLEQAGHKCTGFELNPIAHKLSKYVGSGNCILTDATTVDLSEFDAVWASPPCQHESVARTQGDPESAFSDDLLEWTLGLQSDILWVENVVTPKAVWGKVYNAGQFTAFPLQNRNRMFGGRHDEPHIFRKYLKTYPDCCPAILATEYKGCATDPRRASRHYGRRLTVEECAYHQGFTIPGELYLIKGAVGEHELYRVIGNGVPVYMARAFGEAYG